MGAQALQCGWGGFKISGDGRETPSCSEECEGGGGGDGAVEQWAVTGQLVGSWWACGPGQLSELSHVCCMNYASCSMLYHILSSKFHYSAITCPVLLGSNRARFLKYWKHIAILRIGNFSN